MGREMCSDPPPPTMWVEQLARSKVDLLLRCLYCALLPDPPVLHIAIHYSSQKSLWIPSFCLLSCRRRISSEILYRQMTPVAIFQTLSEAKGLSQSPQKDSFWSRKGCSASLLFQRLHLRERMLIAQRCSQKLINLQQPYLRKEWQNPAQVERDIFLLFHSAERQSGSEVSGQEAMSGCSRAQNIVCTVTWTRMQLKAQPSLAQKVQIHVKLCCWHYV